MAALVSGPEIFPLVTLAVVAGAVAAGFLALWLESLAIDDVSIVDGFWGPGFALAAWLGLALAPARAWVGVAMALMVTLWGLRLTWHMVARHARAGREDARYAAMRARQGPSFRWTSLGSVFLLQAGVLMLVASPVHLAVLAPLPAPTGWALWAGAGLFLAGFLIEAVADAQLSAFTRRPDSHGRTMTAGLWAWSRHPNYLGEIVLWWGLGLYGYGASGSPWAFLGPALLTGLILKVSGISLLEAHMAATRADWADYARRTPRLIPRPPRAE